MNHIILLIICSLSVEILCRANYFSLINSLIMVSKKALNIITNKNISDHWKENIITKYSIIMMKDSLQILLIFLSIIFVLILADNIFSGFLSFIFSINQIVESILIAFSYAYLRRLIVK